jgi:type IV secretion system protein VirD4
MDGAHVHVLYAPNTDETAERISKMLGVTTEIHQQTNYTGGRLNGWLGHVMVSNQETSRPLLTAGEVRELPADDEIVIVAGLPPIRAKKIKYFKDAAFRELVPPTDATGRVTDATHTYAPPKDTALRPYRYGPAPLPSPWAGLQVATPNPIAPGAVPIDSRERDPASIVDLDADDEIAAGRERQTSTAEQELSVARNHNQTVEWDLP